MFPPRPRPELTGILFDPVPNDGWLLTRFELNPSSSFAGVLRGESLSFVTGLKPPPLPLPNAADMISYIIGIMN
jgi:hypothetical protein